MGPFRAAGLFLVALALGTVSWTSVAQDTTAVRIGVLDLNRIYRTSAAAQKIQAEVNSYAETYRQDTERAELELRNAEQELGSKRAILSPEEFAKERRKLEIRVQASQKKVQAHRRSLEQIQAQGLQQVEAALEQVVEQLRKERKLMLILRSEHTAYVDSSLDITDEVLSRLNQKLPTVRGAGTEK